MYGLRERKRTTHMIKRDSNLPEDSSSENEKSEDEEYNLSSQSEKSDNDESKPEDSKDEKDSDGWFEPKKTGSSKPKKMAKRGKYNKTKKEEEKPFISEYEKIRLQSIAERNELLRSMGINVSENTPTVQPKKPREKKVRIEKEKENTPVRISLRLRGKAAEKVNDAFVDESFQKVPEADIDTRNLGCEGWPEDEMEGREKLLEDLKDKLSDINYSSDILNLAACSQECFRDVMLSLVVKDTPKVLDTRIQSLCVHPSNSKRIVFAGSKNGSLGIWDVDAPEEDSFVDLQPNRGPINCISVDDFNPNEIYTTSHDGTITCADIYTKQFINIYATSYDDKINHLTWHHQIDANTLLAAHGDGNVLMIDKREKKLSTLVSCFNRSTRTVQSYPNDSKYFLASSGAVGNGCGIFDLRTKKEVSHLDHDKGTTSAFFSHTGVNIVSTCNDDTVKVWDSTDLNNINLKKSICHNNHTGRWLSVFKAWWHPGRDDIFHIGSLLNPKRIQMYTSKGNLLTELRSVNMVTIQPVIAAHRSLPFIVGGNSSGRLHAFEPPK